MPGPGPERLYRGDTDVQIVRYIPISLFLSG